MTATRSFWSTIPAVALLAGAPVWAEDLVWRASPAPSPPAAAAPARAESTGLSAVLDPPVPQDAPVPPCTFDDRLFPATYRQPPDPDPPPSAARGQPPDSVAPPVSGGPSPLPPLGGNQGVILDRPLGHCFWDKCKRLFTEGDERASATGRCCFQSDPCFPSLASPVTNPFLFEDPRALTEVRPLWFIQGLPGSNIPGGGYGGFFGTQARLALTERWSFVLNELGFVYLEPSTPPPGFADATGFAQLSMGPKWTFWRCPDTGTVAAGGVFFQIPTGSGKVFQDIGTLSMVPYLTVAQNFGRLPQGFGSFNAIATTGYSFSVNGERSDFFYLSTHLDYDVANLHRLWPLIELNWYHYTSAGNGPPLGFEGTDLVNFGSSALGNRDFVTVGPGIRYKFGFCENLWTGLAVEFPLTAQKELTNYRVTWDIIFRF
jgi:hypothetical protein